MRREEIAPHICLSEPKLSFHPTRRSDSAVHPLKGLREFGPYSSGLIPDPLRIATLSSHGDSEKLHSFLSRLSMKYSPKERTDYLPEWPGFRSVFGIQVRTADSQCHIELDAALEDEFQTSPKPHSILADRLVRAIQRLQFSRSEFDVLVVYLPKRWAAAYVEGLEEEFNLHDHLKAITASLGIPIQLVREDSAVAYHCQASVMWHLGVALYAKAGGIPWKLRDTDDETAYIGISYAVRNKGSQGPRFVTCCSQVFDADGAGLEFVAYDAHEFEVFGKNPFLSRLEMFRVMTRSLDLYRRRHAGKLPRRVIVHKTTEFKRDEIDGCIEAFHLCEKVDLVQVVEGVAWRGVRIDRKYGATKGKPAAFPVSRGTIIGISPREALLWTHGDVRGVSTRGSFFKGTRSTPSPLRLVRHAGHGPWDDTVRAVLGLSKMNWNNDSLYDILPVTLAYAKVLARVVKRMPSLRRTPYQFRFFM